ncbi:MAG: hypothetical protein ICV84_19790, partial [Flavisolibacter sp.]|nr:hypothetical protein [Flavisolibacter sp.]
MKTIQFQKDMELLNKLIAISKNENDEDEWEFALLYTDQSSFCAALTNDEWYT